jgi:hypothetical protein
MLSVMLDTPTYFESKWTRQELGRARAKEIHVLRVVWPDHSLLIPEQAAPLFRNDGAPRFRSIAARRSGQSSPPIPG